jgi:serine/threonine protein phosphatase PrpC
MSASPLSRERPLRCPNPECGEIATDADRYCERCGEALWSPGPAVLAQRTLTATVDSCGRCGAPRDAIDGDGFCARCGLRRTPRERDHIEIALPDVAGVSDRGLRHYRNEDALAVASLPEHGARVMVVCDGVSTSEEADRAAQAAAEAARACLVAGLSAGRRDVEALMREAALAAQRAVCAVPYARGRVKDPPSSTFVAAVLLDGRVTVAWLGDCRAYLLGDGVACQLSRDDSWAAEQVRLGAIAELDAACDPRAHVLTRWLGEGEGTGAEPSLATLDVPAGCHLLLCSDGLWNYAPTPGHLRTLVAEMPADAPPVAVARYLTIFARARGGRDNITVVVASV